MPTVDVKKKHIIIYNQEPKELCRKNKVIEFKKKSTVDRICEQDGQRKDGEERIGF